MLTRRGLLLLRIAFPADAGAVKELCKNGFPLIGERTVWGLELLDVVAFRFEPLIDGLF